MTSKVSNGKLSGVGRASIQKLPLQLRLVCLTSSHQVGWWFLDGV